MSCDTSPSRSERLTTYYELAGRRLQPGDIIEVRLKRMFTDSFWVSAKLTHGTFTNRPRLKTKFGTYSISPSTCLRWPQETA